MNSTEVIIAHMYLPTTVVNTSVQVQLLTSEPPMEFSVLSEDNVTMISGNASILRVRKVKGTYGIELWDSKTFTKYTVTTVQCRS